MHHSNKVTYSHNPYSNTENQVSLNPLPNKPFSHVSSTITVL